MLRSWRCRPVLVQPFPKPNLIIAVWRAGHNIIRVQTQCQGVQLITEAQTTIIVLHVPDELLAQLHPFMAGLSISVTPHIACSAQAEQHHLRLAMRAEAYEALAEHVGDALDYDVRWQPNEYEPDGFVERIRPLQLTNGILVASSCPQCGAQLLANRTEIVCTCGQTVSLS
jgi:hypothetical protein